MSERLHKSIWSFSFNKFRLIHRSSSVLLLYITLNYLSYCLNLSYCSVIGTVMLQQFFSQSKELLNLATKFTHETEVTLAAFYGVKTTAGWKYTSHKTKRYPLHPVSHRVQIEQLRPATIAYKAAV